MSRSRKKHAITGITTARSEKGFKRDEHQRERHNVRQRLRINADDTDRRIHCEPYGNPWAGPKDGKVDWTGSDYGMKARRK